MFTPALLIAMSAFAAQPADTGLTPVESAAGWKFLSGVDATKQWRGYKQPSFPKQGWRMVDGELHLAAGSGGGDVITADQFGDFELSLQFETAPKANSGIIYRVKEGPDTTWLTGPEFQVLEDVGYGAKPTDMHATGALYDLYPPSEGKTLKPAGEWNDARIYLRNGVLQHWLNGTKVVEARIFDDAGKPTAEWAAKIAGSKFKDFAGFGVQPRGHLALQDHGDAVGYRNIKVRDLGTPMPGQQSLFNGKDLTGWKAIVPDAASKNISPESVWEVKDGVLICKGNPAGYIRTEKDYTNYILKLQWRFTPGQAGNSGVLLRMVGEDKVWPKSVEAQLHSGSAGDFWNIDEFQMSVDPARTNSRNTRKTHGAERPLGEWNEYEIIVHKGDVILKVNGEELNRAWNVAETPGKICLQSEGVPIQFRDIRIVELH